MKIIIAFTLFISCISAQQTFYEPEQVIAVLTNKFSRINSYKASFLEYYNGTGRKGKILYKKPGFIKITYFRGREPYIEMIANSDKLMVVLMDLNIVCDQDLKEKQAEDRQKDTLQTSAGNLNRLVLLYNFNFIESKFQMPVLGGNENEYFSVLSDTRQAWHFEGTPKNIELGFSKIEIWISSDGMILRSRAHTRADKIIDCLFTDITLNQFIPDSEFQYEIPANYQVIKNNLMEYNQESDKE